MITKWGIAATARRRKEGAARAVWAVFALVLAAACSDDGQSIRAARSPVTTARGRVQAIDDALSLAAAHPAVELDGGGGFRVVPQATRLRDSTRELQRTAGPQWVMAPPLREVALPPFADGEIRLSASGGATISMRRVDALSSPGRLSEGVVEYAAAVDGLDAMVFATERGVEDLWTIHSPRSRWGYELELPQAWRLHVARGVEGLVEVRDNRDVARLRMWARAAWDATGAAIPISVSAEAHRIWLSLPKNAAYPVVVDPEWAATDTMTFSRAFLTLTPLANGQVLVAGGEWVTRGAAELFDPATSSFTTSGIPARRRAAGWAFRLGPSRVLLVGGASLDPGQPLHECEWYNTDTGTFEPGPSMIEGGLVEGAVAVQLGDGSVLVAGAFESHAELFDPGTDTESFSSTHDLVEAQSHMSAVVLASGKVWLTGGTGADEPVSASAEFFDPISGVFSAGPKLPTARVLHQSLLRPSGEVLLVAGRGLDSTHLPQLELVVPETGETREASSMIDPRTVRVSAVALADGSVLLIGGATWSGEALAETEIHYPEEGFARPGPRLHFPRQDQSAVLLPDGRVLVAGSSTQLAAPTAEILQPDAFTPGPMQTLQWPRVRHTATKLKNGNVVIAAGERSVYNNPSQARDVLSVDSFNPTSNTFHPAGRLVGVHSGTTATLLPTGKVLFVGGVGASQSAELYDPDAEISTPWVALLHGRAYHTATLLDEDHVLITGGCDSTETETIEISTRSVELSGSLLEKRSEHTASLLPDKRVLLVGGQADAEIFDLETELSTPTAIDASRAAPTTVALPSGEVLVLGGGRNTIEHFDHKSDTWSVSAATLETLQYMTATVLATGEVLIVGGIDDQPTALNTAVLYDPMTRSLASVGSTKKSRHGHTATLLDDNRVLITGGEGVTSKATATAELYDPNSHSFSLVNPGEEPNESIGQTATLLPTGRVLLTGGATGGCRTGQIWDTASRTTTDTDSMVESRAGHAATPLRDGTVLITGGRDWGRALSTTEIYVEKPGGVGEFRVAPSMEHARFNHTATLLPSGQVLLAGGEDSGVAELYDPSTGQMRRAGEMLQVRYNHGASVLSSGWVLLAGGTDEGGDTPVESAELYDPETSTFHEVAWSTGIGGATRTAVDRAGNAFIAGPGAGIVLSETLEFVSPLGGLPDAPTTTFPLLWGGVGICGRSSVSGSTSCQAASAQGLDSEPLLFVPGNNGIITRLASGDLLVRSKPESDTTSLVFSAVPEGAIRPTVNTVLKSLRIGEEGTLTGKRFTSPPMKGAEALGPSADILPWVVFVPNAGGPSVLFPMKEWTDTTIRFEAAATTFHGPGWLHVLVQGVPSEGQYMVLEPKLDGSACDIDGECEHGSCEEGVCCNTRCDSPCLSCLAANNGSDADGQCLPVAEGTDPKDACSESLESTCGLTGVCDDQGQCAPYSELYACAADKICREGTCEATLGETCDSTLECAKGQACGEDGTCVPSRPSSVVVDGGCNLGGPPRGNRAWIALLAIALAASRPIRCRGGSQTRPLVNARQPRAGQ